MLQLFSPAKINLFLRVVSKRTDGYHELSSVFQTLSLGDTLTIEYHTHDVLTCTDPSVPTDQSNLILKAIHLFRLKTGFRHFFRIHLDKKIPMQAGLGGGSSNAATTLWACNQLAQTYLPDSMLKEWGATLGSDIPFFFSQGTAYCTGRGEHVHPLPALDSQSLWIVKPLEGLSTPEVFKKLNFNTNVSEKFVPKDLEDFTSGKLSYFNDLEKPAFEIKPSLKQLKEQLLEKGFETAVMTGSGSSFFCLGQGCLPEQSSILCFPAHFINRLANQWYL